MKKLIGLGFVVGVFFIQSVFSYQARGQIFGLGKSPLDRIHDFSKNLVSALDKNNAIEIEKWLSPELKDMMREYPHQKKLFEIYFDWLAEQRKKLLFSGASEGTFSQEWDFTMIQPKLEAELATALKKAENKGSLHPEAEKCLESKGCLVWLREKVREQYNHLQTEQEKTQQLDVLFVLNLAIQAFPEKFNTVAKKAMEARKKSNQKLREKQKKKSDKTKQVAVLFYEFPHIVSAPCDQLSDELTYHPTPDELAGPISAYRAIFGAWQIQPRTRTCLSTGNGYLLRVGMQGVEPSSQKTKTIGVLSIDLRCGRRGAEGTCEIIGFVPEYLRSKQIYETAKLEDEQDKTNRLVFLLQRGVLIDTKDNEGLTPLMVAARECQLSAAKTLLAYGASKSVKTGQAQKTAYDFALDSKCVELEELLKL